MDDIKQEQCSLARLEMMQLMSEQSQKRFNESCDRLNELGLEKVSVCYAIADRTQQALGQLA
jgi:hypothetical protein